MEIPNILICEGRPIYVVVDRHRPLCWACGAAGHLLKACPGMRPESQPQPTTSKGSIDRGRVASGRSNDRSLINLIGEFGLIDTQQVNHPGQVWTWALKWLSTQVVRRADIVLLDCPTFHWLDYLDHRLCSDSTRCQNGCTLKVQSVFTGQVRLLATGNQSRGQLLGIVGGRTLRIGLGPLPPNIAVCPR